MYEKQFEKTKQTQALSIDNTLLCRRMHEADGMTIFWLLFSVCCAVAIFSAPNYTRIEDCTKSASINRRRKKKKTDNLLNCSAIW